MRAFDLLRALRSIKPRRRSVLPPNITLHSWSFAAILKPQFKKEWGVIL